MRISHLLLILSATLMFVSPVFAKRGQAARIRHGVKSGALTKDEAKNLRSERKANHEQAKAARADGNVTPEERENLRKSRRETSKHIHDEKHDGDKAPKDDSSTADQIKKSDSELEGAGDDTD